jgi:C1A family cysteine protease
MATAKQKDYLRSRSVVATLKYIHTHMLSWLFNARRRYTTHTSAAPVFGWTPDLPDFRDKYYFAFDSHCVNTICVPPKVDLRTDFPVVVYDQGALKSSVANALASLIEFERLYHYKSQHYTPSRLFLHYIYRQAEGLTAHDVGASIRTTIKMLNKTGVCGEDRLPYDVERFADKPDDTCYEQAAATNERFKYYRVKQTLSQIKAVLVEGQPIVFGFTVYENMVSSDTAKTGVCIVPSERERPLGGHVGVLCGYNDAARMFVFRNSWGSEWGDGGYGYLDYDFVTNPDLAGDFWVLVLDVNSDGQAHDDEIPVIDSEGELDTDDSDEEKSDKMDVE